MLTYYRVRGLTSQEQAVLKEMGVEPEKARAEWCNYAGCNRVLLPEEQRVMGYVLAETFEPENFSRETFLGQYPEVIEVGPRLNFATAFSSTSVDILQRCGVKSVTRLEQSRRLALPRRLTEAERRQAVNLLHDRMTEMEYVQPLKSFDHGLRPALVRVVPVLAKGRAALWEINKQLGLGWDEQDVEFCYNLFAVILRRDPTEVEVFQVGQANSEHCRHWFFRARLVIDGKGVEVSLMDLIKKPLRCNPGNSMLAFCDNSSAIYGGDVLMLVPSRPGEPSPFLRRETLLHAILTAETHNHPCGKAAGPGADTATGGRIRDDEAIGQGGFPAVAGAGYCAAYLGIAGYDLPWEKNRWPQPANMERPIDILIQASHGCSRYGNCFGEPVIYGFVRTGEVELPDGHRGWFKPVVYSVGAGFVDDRHLRKPEPKKDMLVVLVGGPAYRIGVGGGSASSMIAGANSEELDFASVQRGAPEMANRGDKFVRTCIEMGDKNPIEVIHDLGAGGTCNALPEAADPAGAVIEMRQIPSGDNSLSAREWWGNEAQERNVILIWPESLPVVQKIAARENAPLAVVGRITGDGQFRLYDEADDSYPVDLPLDKVLGDLPPKTFKLERVAPQREPLVLPEGLTVREALDRVLRLPSVASKSFLTSKGDRSVTGRVVQQQCVGPHHVTLCDYAVIAASYFDKMGTALSLGEQPVKGLVSPQAMVRMVLTEALLNMCGAVIDSLRNVTFEANWMLAAKERGEGAWLYDAVVALNDFCLQLGVSPDGGKDSLSMAAKLLRPETGEQEVVKAPGQFVAACNAKMPDITCKVTPDLKGGDTVLVHIDLSGGRRRLGGSALAQVYEQVGNDCPDMNNPDLLVRAFKAVQHFVREDLITAVHDCSDGGLIVAVLEMAFAGGRGVAMDLQHDEYDALSSLFAEEAGLVLEVPMACVEKVIAFLDNVLVPSQMIGTVYPDHYTTVTVTHNGDVVVNESVFDLRALWEETSMACERLQRNPECVREEVIANRYLKRGEPPFNLTFITKTPEEFIIAGALKPRVAILREQGSNGDREMAAAFEMAGFEVWDVTMTDLLLGLVNLDMFRGVVFVGGFSFGDVLDAGKGWAAVIKFNRILREQFEAFFKRPDTFSLGVCNGCQLMALLEWPFGLDVSSHEQPRFIHNTSGWFEMRFPTV
ncbi:MAG: phosphoribosylformylglycinamidine synthase, partial [Candidatus Andersenbacteria bacterium]|nr:phosphoribosylformylglycinamidine synthase [Candidatus Andersenbacteria bacterium]